MATTIQPCDLNSLLKGPDVLALEEFSVNSFHVCALIIFICAIIHTLLSNQITNIAERVEKNHLRKDPNGVSFWGEVLRFLGEVEVIFGLWVIPLFVLIGFFYQWHTAVQYINTRNYTEAIFVVVIMSLASSRPIVRLAEDILHVCSKLLGNKISSWWFTILTIGPLLGSVITEAGAMALSAMLLSRQFYVYNPDKKLCYATLGLLFANISVGGVLTNFAAPPVLVISRCWDWSSWFMLTNFGWKAALGIVFVNVIYWLVFRKSFISMQSRKTENLQQMPARVKIPIWITFIHILFLIWTVANSHYPAVFIASFLLFLGFHHATRPHQYVNNLRRPLLVGFFLAGLIIHGGIQGWWVTPLLEQFHYSTIMVLSIVLTAFNDNAAISYLASLIPSTPMVVKYAVIAGVLSGGGLTVIANAPNPAGHSILRKHFDHGISPLRLFLGALFPTIVFSLVFFLTIS